ncbi:hypothetical protein Tco_0122466 [Tanacetum coccineum]
MAPMASSDTEVKTCSKTCLKNYESLKKQYDDLVARKHETEFKAITYKRGLDTVEAQLVTYRKNEVLFSEEVVVLKREVGIKQYEINTLKTEFEKLKQEKDAIDFKIEKFGKASKDLDQLLGSQITDKSKKGFGYSAVPPPHPLIYNRPNKLDLSYSGLEEFQQPEFEVYGLRANKSVCENSSNETKKNSDAPLIEEWVSDNEDEVESPIVVEKKTVVPTIPKVDVVRPKQQEKSVRKTVRMTYSNPRRNMIPQAVLMRSGIKAVNTAKPKDAHNAVKRNRFNTVKASTCWVWMPKNRVVDNVSKNTSASNNIEKEDKRSRKKLKGNKSDLEVNNEHPDKMVCKADKFEAIKYSLGPKEECIAIKRCEYNAWERNEDSVSQIYQEIFWKNDEGWMDLAGKEIDEVGEVSIIWNPMCVVVMLESIRIYNTHSCS